MERFFARLRAAGRTAGALALLGLWLGVMGAASSERLHEFLHPDAHQPAHDCAITQLAKGQILIATAGGVPLLLLLARPGLAPALPTLVLAETDLRLLPPRGPPVVSLPLH